MVVHKVDDSLTGGVLLGEGDDQGPSYLGSGKWGVK